MAELVGATGGWQGDRVHRVRRRPTTACDGRNGSADQCLIHRSSRWCERSGRRGQYRGGNAVPAHHTRAVRARSFRRGAAASKARCRSRWCRIYRPGGSGVGGNADGRPSQLDRDQLRALVAAICVAGFGRVVRDLCPVWIPLVATGRILDSCDGGERVAANDRRCGCDDRCLACVDGAPSMVVGIGAADRHRACFVGCPVLEHAVSLGNRCFLDSACRHGAFNGRRRRRRCCRRRPLG